MGLFCGGNTHLWPPPCSAQPEQRVTHGCDAPRERGTPFWGGKQQKEPRKKPRLEREGADLEVEDPSIAVLEALAVRHHAVQDGLVQRQGRDGCQQPAVTWVWSEKRGFWGCWCFPVGSSCPGGASGGSTVILRGAEGREFISIDPKIGTDPKMVTTDPKVANTDPKTDNADPQTANVAPKTLSTDPKKLSLAPKPPGEVKQPLPLLPSAPWQMSVRVAPSTMNLGFRQSSWMATRGETPEAQINGISPQKGLLMREPMKNGQHQDIQGGKRRGKALK